MSDPIGHPMHRTVRTYALKYKVRLGRDHLGYYFIRDDKGNKTHISMTTTAASGLAMMRKAGYRPKDKRIVCVHDEGEEHPISGGEHDVVKDAIAEHIGIID